MRIIKFDLTTEEAILFLAFLLLIAYFVLLTLSKFVVKIKVCLFGK